MARHTKRCSVCTELTRHESLGHQMYDAPDGYYFGNADGKSVHHLVRIEGQDTGSQALCGVYTYIPSHTTIKYVGAKLCGKCLRLAGYKEPR